MGIEAYTVPSIRDFQINGETLVKVKGTGGLANPNASSQPYLWELGLADDPVVLSPVWTHKEIKVDDFGPNVPAELLWMLAEVQISMTLIHYDNQVLDGCMVNAMAGGVIVDTPPNAAGQSFNGYAGYMAGAGTPLGGGKELQTRGNYWISLNLLSPVLGFPWRFPAAVLAGQPVVIPLGVQATAVRLNWRAIPYRSPVVNGSGVELKSAGAPLWDHTEDSN